jgi:Flp pilus assembly protein TadD
VFDERPETALVHRARRLHERGDDRRAMLVLREAVCRQDTDARLWTLYGVQCARSGRIQDAEHALGQALWLRKREKDAARVSVTQRLLECVQRGERQMRLNAA